MTQRILVIRLSALGDIAMATGLIPALRARFPRAHLAWLAEPAGAELLQANPRLDEVIVLPRPHWRALRRAGRRLRAAREMRDFARALRARRFDLALDPQGLLKSAIWGWISGAPRRLGLANAREGSARLMTELVAVARNDPRIASEYRRMAEHLGAAPDDFAMDLVVTDADLAEPAGALAGAGVDADYAVFCPFTTRPQKHWFDERWVELGRSLWERTGLIPVILGGPGDRTHAERLAGASSGTLRTLAGALSLRASLASIQGARLLVGVDTGLTHMGTASAIPTVALFGSTRPYLETGSLNAQVLYEPLWCSPCRRHPICGGMHSCMRVHHVDAVTDLAVSLREAAA